MTVPLRFDQMDTKRQDVIRTNIAKMRAAGAPDDDVETYLTQHEHVLPAGSPTPHGASGSWGDEPREDTADRSALGNVSRSLFQGATLGAGNKIMSAGNAAIDKVFRGMPYGQAYGEHLADERAAEKDFTKRHPVGNIATEAVGGLGAMLASGGASAPEEFANLGRLARVGVRAGKAAMTGADLGAVSGAINADGGVDERLKGAVRGSLTGGLGAAVLAPLGEGAGYLAKKVHIPEVLSAGASKVAGALPDGNRWNSLREMLESGANALGPKGEAASEVGRRMEMDAGTPRTPISSNAPAMALDQGGKNLESLAKGIVKRPGPAGADIANALTERQTQMRPQVSQAFDAETGTTLADGEALLQRLTDEHKRAASAAVVAKLVGQEARAAKPASVDPIATWSDLTGGDHARTGSTGVQALRELVDAQGAEARQLYGAAREATAGQPVESPTLDEVMKTPVGKLAFSWAKMQKGNRGQSLPTVPGAEKPPGGMDPGAWADAQARMKTRPDITPFDVQLGGEMGHEADAEMPDPEALHYMKQYLAKVARLGVNDGAQGTIATQAHGALGVWGKIRDEMPDVWRSADDAFAKKARTIDMLNAGRNIMRTQLNPPGAGRRALSSSLDALEERVAQASPEEQHAFRVGAQSAVADHLKSGGKPASIIAQAGDPSSVMSRRLALATGDQSTAQRFAGAMLPRPQQIPAAPPVPMLSGEDAAAARGLDVLHHGVSGTPRAPDRTLGNLRDVAGQMNVGERAGLQQGAAQAVRGEFAGASRSVEAPGRVFASSPERTEQVGHAFASPDHEARFQGLVKDWDAIAQRKQRILGGSDTFANAAEDAARSKGSSATSQLLHGHPFNAARSLLGGMSNEATSAQRQQVDKALADILTSIDPRALSNAQSSAQLRARLDALRASMYGVTAAQHTPRP